MNVINDIAKDVAQLWGTIALAIDLNFSEQTSLIENKANSSDIPDTSNFVTRLELGDIETILDNIIGE